MLHFSRNSLWNVKVKPNINIDESSNPGNVVSNKCRKRTFLQKRKTCEKPN